jgi:hypothetical protein
MAKKKKGWEEGVEDTGYQEGADYSSPPPAAAESSAEEEEVESLGSGLRDHLTAILEKHKPGDPNLPSVIEVSARSHALRALQLLAEAMAAAAKAASYEVPEEDEERREEAKKNAAALEAKQKELDAKQKEKQNA